MGSEQCQQCKQEKLESYAYGDHEVIHQRSQVYATVEKKVQKDPKLQGRVIKQLELRKKIQNPHIVKLCKYQIHHEDYGFKVNMFYQYVPKTLRCRIEEHQAKGTAFTEKQLFSLVYGIETALQELSQLGIKHCCINLDTIVCRNNFYKLTDVSSTTYLTSYELVKKGNREQFLSQHLLENLAHQSLDPIYEVKDDLFSLGMIVLVIVYGCDPNTFYKWDEKKKHIGYLNVPEVDKAFQLLEAQYSSRLGKKIRSLIFQNQTQKSQITNLSDSLQELDDEINRVLMKCQNQKSISLSNSKLQNSHFSLYHH